MQGSTSSSSIADEVLVVKVWAPVCRRCGHGVCLSCDGTFCDRFDGIHETLDLKGEDDPCMGNDDDDGGCDIDLGIDTRSIAPVQYGGAVDYVRKKAAELNAKHPDWKIEYEVVVKQ